MKKRFIALVACMLISLLFVFTSCTVEEASVVSIFDMYDTIEKMLDLDKNSLNSKNEYVNSVRYLDASENFLLISERVTVDNVEMKKLSVKSIKTNDEIYSITFNEGTIEPSKIYDVEIVLGKDEYSINDIGKDYFIVTTLENPKESHLEKIITAEIHNVRNEKLCSYKGSLSSFEKVNYVPKIKNMHFDATLEQERPCVFQKNDHVFFMNKLYRHDEAGLVLVTEIESERLFDLDISSFDYINERYVSASSDGELYVFDKEFNFVRHDKVDIPFGYDYKVIGNLSLDKIVYVLDKRVNKDDLVDGEAYDFIFDGVAYTREFYTYNFATGNTGAMDDILYKDRIDIICKDYIDFKYKDEGVELGAEIFLTTDLEMIDDKYYERESITYTTTASFYELVRIDNEIYGCGVSILGKLSTGNYVVSLPFEIGVFSKNKEEIGRVSGEVLKITDKYIVTDKGIYDHELKEKYLFAVNEELYGAVGNTLIILSTTKDSAFNSIKTYYSFGDNGKKEIISVDGYSFGGVTCYDTFYRVEKRVDNKYITTFLFENGEVIAEIETKTAYTDNLIFFTRLDDALIITYEKDNEYQYVYAYVK